MRGARARARSYMGRRGSKNKRTTQQRCTQSLLVTPNLNQNFHQYQNPKPYPKFILAIRILIRIIKKCKLIKTYKGSTLFKNISCTITLQTKFSPSVLV